MASNDFIEGLLSFLASSPTPFHATRQIAQILDSQGFERLNESEPWQLAAGSQGYVVRNGGSIIALRTGADLASSGVRMIGAHTDSPCLRIKPEPELTNGGYLRLGVEVYGGALLNPWFDRDLSIAGRVHFVNVDGDLTSALIDFRKPVASIPSLAIHLDRDANQNRSVNPQKDIPLLLMRVAGDAAGAWRHMLVEQIRSEHPDLGCDRVLDWELSCYDTQPPAVIGMQGDFITSARLDNLVSCYCGLQALLAGDPEVPAVLVCNDHEEVGSMSASGAQGPFLRSVLERLVGAGEPFTRLMARSMLISADNAHGIHPNFSDRHDANHGPLLNGGPVIKVNANQRYASNSGTQALFRKLAESAEVPVQTFVVRTDMACGSTIGPITAAELGVATLDVGIPQFAMHSIREICGARDPEQLTRVLTAFTSVSRLPDGA